MSSYGRMPWRGDLSAEGRRRVNIDPGYLAKAHLILATGKGYTHRPYLRDGIYADLTLMYRDKTFHPLPWTYPDYAGGEVIGMLTRIREKYMLQLKGKAGDDAPVGRRLPVPGDNIVNEEMFNDQKHDRLRQGRGRPCGQEICDRDEVGQPPLSGDLPAPAGDAVSLWRRRSRSGSGSSSPGGGSRRPSGSIATGLRRPAVASP